MNTRDSTSRPLEGHEPLGTKAVGLTLLTSALWGGTPVAISYSLDVLPPFAVSGLRFGLATLFMLVWCRIEKTELRLRSGQVKFALVAGLLLFMQIGLFTLGIKLSNSSHATLIINTFVFWIVGFEHFVSKTTRLTRNKFVGLGIAATAVGFVLLTTESGGENNTTSSNDVATLSGDVCLMLSAMLLAIKIIYTKHAIKHVEPGKLILWHDIIGVALFAIYSVMFEQVRVESVTSSAIVGLLYQGLIVAGFCFAVQTRLLKRHPASMLAVFSFMTPLFGVTLAAVFRDDNLSPWLIAAGVCVALGIWLVNRSESTNSSRGL